MSLVLLDMSTPEWMQLAPEEQASRAASHQTECARRFGASTVCTEQHGPLEVEWVLIPPGRYLRGADPDDANATENESPQHAVELKEPFWLGRYVITQAQWSALTGTRPWDNEQYALDNPRCPAVCISWLDIKKIFLPAVPDLRLPREAEWEYACRAGTTTRYYWGEDRTGEQINEYAWHGANAWNVEEKFAHEVGLKKPNAFGLFDMSGNVLEWCEEEMSGYGCDGEPVMKGTMERRIVRGGYFSFWASRCRSSYRCSCVPSLRDCLIGFRVARDFRAV